LACPDSPRAWSPVPRTHQEIGTTASRHAQPRAWLRAVRWLVAAGLHPRAGTTTLQVAADLARRMDYTEGTVLYDMLGTARRTRARAPRAPSSPLTGRGGGPPRGARCCTTCSAPPAAPACPCRR